MELGLYWRLFQLQNPLTRNLRAFFIYDAWFTPEVFMASYFQAQLL